MSKVKRVIQVSAYIKHTASYVVEMDDWFAESPVLMDQLANKLQEHACDHDRFEETNEQILKFGEPVIRATAYGKAEFAADNDMDGVEIRRK